MKRSEVIKGIEAYTKGFFKDILDPALVELFAYRLLDMLEEDELIIPPKTLLKDSGALKNSYYSEWEPENEG